MSRVDDAEAFTRDVLELATVFLKEPYQGYVFAAGLVITDHIFRPIRAVFG